MTMSNTWSSSNCTDITRNHMDICSTCLCGLPASRDNHVALAPVSSRPYLSQNLNGKFHTYVFYNCYGFVFPYCRHNENLQSHLVHVDHSLEVRDGLSSHHDGVVSDFATGLTHPPTYLWKWKTFWFGPKEMHLQIDHIGSWVSHVVHELDQDLDNFVKHCIN